MGIYSSLGLPPGKLSPLQISHALAVDSSIVHEEHVMNIILEYEVSLYILSTNESLCDLKLGTDTLNQHHTLWEAGVVTHYRFDGPRRTFAREVLWCISILCLFHLSSGFYCLANSITIVKAASNNDQDGTIPPIQLWVTEWISWTSLYIGI